jgi:hypothetical protein
VQLVNLRGDTPHRDIVTIGDPGTPSCMLEKVILGGKLIALHQAKWRNPGWIVRVNTVGQIQELSQSAGSRNLFYRQGHTTILRMGHDRQVSIGHAGQGAAV